MNATLSRRLVVWIGVPGALLFAAVLWFSSQRSVRRVVSETEVSARTSARYFAARLDGRLSEAARIATMNAHTVESNLFRSREELENYLRSAVEANPEIYGSCVAFRPHGFDDTLYGYAPYYYRSERGIEFVQLAVADYNYFQWDWYRRPRDDGRALWTEPYFVEGSDNVLTTTYSVPFRKDNLFWGIATIDIALTQLLAETERITVGHTGYAMLIAKSGRLLAYPDASKVMAATLQESNAQLATMMMAGEDGFQQTREPLRGEDAWIAFAPVQAGGFSLAIVYPKKEVLAAAFNLQREQIALGVVGLLALFGALFFIARSISRPITDLARAAQEVAQGNLEQRLEVNAPLEEVRHLTFAFNKMTRDLRMRMRELRDTTAAKERIEGELSAARTIQMSLIPKQFPAFPGREEIDLHALVKPAREVGGDFYDFHLVADDWLCFFIGDVSGKGVPAALFMAVTKTLLTANSPKPDGAAEMLAKVNDELCAQTDSGMFVSLIYALLDLRTGALEIGNAGHPAPFILHAAGAVTSMETERNIALGAVSPARYEITHTRIAPGDALFVFTDGVTEALNSDGQFYSARLEAALRDLATLPAEKITRGVAQDVQAFTAEREQSDDISVMAVRWRGPASATQPR